MGAGKGGCAPERVKMARLAETTVSSLSSEVVCGWDSVETRVLPNVESSGGSGNDFIHSLIESAQPLGKHLWGWNETTPALYVFWNHGSSGVRRQSFGD